MSISNQHALSFRVASGPVGSGHKGQKGAHGRPAPSTVERILLVRNRKQEGTLSTLSRRRVRRGRAPQQAPLDRSWVGAGRASGPGAGYVSAPKPRVPCLFREEATSARGYVTASSHAALQTPAGGSPTHRPASLQPPPPPPPPPPRSIFEAGTLQCWFLLHQ